jgi:hypothetical protein
MRILTGVSLYYNKTKGLIFHIGLLRCITNRAGHLLLFTLFANRYSATSLYHFAIATPLIF